MPMNGTRILSVSNLSGRSPTSTRITPPHGANRKSGSGPLSVVTLGSVSRGCGGVGRVKPARPYICRLIIFVLVFTPSVRPLLNGGVRAAATAWRSDSSPRVNACRWGRAAKSPTRAASPVISGQAAVAALIRSCWWSLSLPGRVSR